jgi:putative membrane protein
MWLWWLGILALIVGVLWAVARGAAAQGRAGENAPETVLKRRYARGELNREEYEQRLRELRM